MNAVLLSQYEMVCDARKVLLEYCAGISKEDFIRSSNEMGNGGSIRNLLVHICNSYTGWLQHFALKQPFHKRAYETCPHLQACEQYYIETDELVLRFLKAFETDHTVVIDGQIGSSFLSSTPLKLFTHVITHEFHHKGQILALGRMWGYTPVDTDILR